MKILKVLTCALALVSNKRSPELVGTERVKLNAYNDGVKEYCMEEHWLMGQTWVDDKYLYSREVELESCYEI